MKGLIRSISVAIVLAWAGAAQAIPVPCIVCGSTVIIGVGPNSGTVSYAVISGADFLIQTFPFFGAVPSGTLDALGSAVLPTDFVYMYQNVNTGLSLIFSHEVSIDGAAASLTAGGRIESTLFVDPFAVATVTLSPIPSTPPGIPGLPVGLPVVDFVTFLNPGPCLGSGALPGNQCSDGTTNLLPTSVEMISFDETPAAPLLDPGWTSSIMWFASPLAPVFLPATEFFADGTSASGPVATVPEPSTAALLGLGLLGLASVRQRRRA
jgi:hypothetical protein